MTLKKKSPLQETLYEDTTVLTYSRHIQSLLQCHPKSHTQRSLQHMQNIHTLAFLLSHYLCQYETRIHPHAVPLTAEVVVEPRHQVEG